MTCHVQLGIPFCEWKKVKLCHSAAKTKYHVHLCNCANVQLCTYVLYTNLWDISIKSRRHSFIFSIRHYFDLKKLEKNYYFRQKMRDSLVLICIVQILCFASTGFTLLLFVFRMSFLRCCMLKVFQDVQRGDPHARVQGALSLCSH